MKQHESGSRITEVRRSITIGKPADELYCFWRDPKTLSEITSEMLAMTPTGPSMRAGFRLQKIGRTT